MLRIRKTPRHYELVKVPTVTNIIIAAFDSVESECFSPDVAKMIQEDEVQVRIISEDEYQYFLDVEEMLVSLQALIKEEIEDETR